MSSSVEKYGNKSSLHFHGSVADKKATQLHARPIALTYNLLCVLFDFSARRGSGWGRDRSAYGAVTTLFARAFVFQEMQEDMEWKHKTLLNFRV